MSAISTARLTAIVLCVLGPACRCPGPVAADAATVAGPWSARPGNCATVATVPVASTGQVEVLIGKDSLGLSLSRVPDDLWLLSTNWDGGILTLEDLTLPSAVVADVRSASATYLSNAPVWLVTQTTKDRLATNLRLVNEHTESVLARCTRFQGGLSTSLTGSLGIAAFSGQCDNGCSGVAIVGFSTDSMSTFTEICLPNGQQYAVAPEGTAEAYVKEALTTQTDAGSTLVRGLRMAWLEPDAGRWSESIVETHTVRSHLGDGKVLAWEQPSPTGPVQPTHPWFGSYQAPGMSWTEASDLAAAVPIIQTTTFAGSRSLVRGKEFDGGTRFALLRRAEIERTFNGQDWMLNARGIALFDDILCGTIMSVESNDAGDLRKYKVCCDSMR